MFPKYKPKVITKLILTIFLLFNPASIVIGAELNSKTETYEYIAVPLKSGGESEKENISSRFYRNDSGLNYTSEVLSSEGREVIRIKMLKDGRFISAEKDVLNSSGVPEQKSSILTKEGSVYIKNINKNKEALKTDVLPKDRPFAVDGSLLVMMRLFPFGENKIWKIFMADFSGSFITVDLEMAGEEKISVPAGEFECYKMRITVNQFIFQPKIYFWISKQEPHFMVKHTGKRGPFTKTYSTSLISLGSR